MRVDRAAVLQVPMHTRRRGGPWLQGDPEKDCVIYIFLDAGVPTYPWAQRPESTDGRNLPDPNRGEEGFHGYGPLSVCKKGEKIRERKVGENAASGIFH